MVCVGIGSTGSAAAAVAVVAAGALVAQAASELAQAAGAAAEASLRLVGERGEALEALGAQQADAELVNRRWHMAAAEAVGVNATIRLLAQRAKGLGLDVALPPPVELDGRSQTEVIAWLNRTRPMLQQSRGELEKAITAGEWERLVSVLAGTAAELEPVGVALARHQEALRRRHATPDEPAMVDLSAVEADVRKALERLDADADAPDRDAVLEAAARVSRQTDEDDADAYLRALRAKIKEINPRMAARRLAARALEGFETPAVQRALAGADVPWAGVPGELRAVVDGSAELTPALHHRVRGALTWAAGVARIAYRIDVIVGLLEKQDFVIVQRSDTHLRIRRADWSDEHTADVWLDAESGVHAGLMRETAGRGDDLALREADRAAALRIEMSDLVHELSHQGIGGLVGHDHTAQHRTGDEFVEQPGLTVLAPRERRPDRQAQH